MTYFYYENILFLCEIKFGIFASDTMFEILNLITGTYSQTEKKNIYLPRNPFPSYNTFHSGAVYV